MGFSRLRIYPGHWREGVVSRDVRIELNEDHQVKPIVVWQGDESYFGHDDNLFSRKAQLPNCITKDYLGFPIRVDVGRVERVNSGIISAN
jgi:hypothetical protein